MISQTEVFLNASQHIFDLGLSETLMLRNYTSKNNWKFCSMIGGSESIRDLQESKNLFVDAFEFPMVESIFSIKKIFSALEKVFGTNSKSFADKKFFITIGSIDGLSLLKEINKLTIPSYINKKDLIFIFDRRMIIRSLKNVTNNNFDVVNFEPEINIIIDEYIKLLTSNCYRYCISGGITEKSLDSFKNFSTYPNFIKAGIFTIKINQLLKNNLFKNILKYQSTEAKIISIMKKSINYKNDYLNVRELHMIKYLINSLT